MVAALYRRYRPESFAEMIGQSQVTDPLMTALRTGRIGHAYLFSGPRGCGKTTSARILARCLNCAEGPADTPCGSCDSCVELSRDGGGSLDVVEIDAASHGGVDDARDLRERAVFAPARDRFKIFIIDEAHMVTPGGFNALLKIVEEPPPHVKFVFATTEPDKVIGTIRSRTHHYPFRLIAPATLIDYVQSLCDSEGVEVEPGVLPLVVRAGGGSVRDTLSILDQLIAGSEGGRVTAARAAGLLGFTHSELLDDVVAAFGAHDPAAAFRATDRVVQTGQDPRRFVEDLLERLRDLIVVGATTVDGAAAVFRGVPQDQLARMFEQAQAFAPGELSRVADTVSSALDKMAGATAPRLQLELMVARALVAQEDLVAQRQPAPGLLPPQGGAMPNASAGGGSAAGTSAAATSAAGTSAAGPSAPGAPARSASGDPHRPTAQGAPAEDPLAAVASIRGAAGAAAAPAESPASGAAAPAQAASPGGRPPAPETPPVSPASGEGTGQAPNAAETAASIRDFLSKDPAGAAPHPNEGAAGFGRPISAVLSAAEIESIGAERPAPSAAPAPADSSPGSPTAAPSSADPSSARPSPAEPSSTEPSSAEPSSNAASSTSPRSADPATEPAPTEPSSTEPATTESAPADPASTEPSPSGPLSGSVPSSGFGTGGSAPADASVSEEPSPGPDAGTVEDASPSGGFDDLVELWPELLEEILEHDRDAWNAVRQVTPLALDGEVLTIGLASESDLAAFKTTGAGPLRNTIQAAVGISVKYVPKRMPQATREAGAPEARSGAQPDTEEPHRGSSSSTAEPHRGSASLGTTEPRRDPSSNTAETARAVPDHDSDDPMLRAAARLSALGPALAAPAWADPPSESSASTPAPVPPGEADDPASRSGLSDSSGRPESGEADRAAATSTQAATAAREAPAPDPADYEPGPYDGLDDPYRDDAYGNDGNDAFANDAYGDDPYSGNDPYAGGGPAEESASSPSASSAATAASATAASVRGSSAPAGSASASSGPVSVSSNPGASSTPGASSPAAVAAIATASPGAAATPAASASAGASGAPGARTDTAVEAKKPAPSFVRYGEAVVREVLGARFIEERPLPSRREV